MAPSDVLLSTAKAYLDALSAVDADGIAAITTESFYATLAPSSTGLSGKDGVSATRQDIIQRFAGLKAAIASMNIQIQQEWPPNEASNQVTIWTKADADFLPQIVGDDSKDDWSFKPETLFIFTMDESGKKVERVFEFQDSLAVQGMTPLFVKAMEKIGMSLPGNKK